VKIGVAAEWKLYVDKTPVAFKENTPAKSNIISGRADGIY